MTNDQLIRLNTFLKLVTLIVAAITSAALARQIPHYLEAWMPTINLIGIIAAFIAKTPSQAIAAAVPPPSKDAPK